MCIIHAGNLSVASSYSTIISSPLLARKYGSALSQFKSAYERALEPKTKNWLVSIVPVSPLRSIESLPLSLIVSVLTSIGAPVLYTSKYSPSASLVADGFAIHSVMMSSKPAQRANCQHGENNDGMSKTRGNKPSCVSIYGLYLPATAVRRFTCSNRQIACRKFPKTLTKDPLFLAHSLT